MLLQKSAFEPDAYMQMRNTCLPYMLLHGHPSLSSMCNTIPRLHADAKERHCVQGGFITCMRDAYPDEAMPDDFILQLQQHDRMVAGGSLCCAVSALSDNSDTCWRITAHPVAYLLVRV